MTTRVLVLGASGFIGARIAHALAERGYEVVCGVRRSSPDLACRPVRVDFVHDHDVADWLPRLAGIDIVINAVGILRERGGATFEALHVKAPIALFEACEHGNVKKVVQLSALGADEHATSAYHLSKKRADDALAQRNLAWVIVQPALVFGQGGASAALFTTLAALPLIPVPGRGDQRIQPVHIDDLVQLVVRLLGTADHDSECIAAVGARALTLREYLAILRAAMHLGRPYFLDVPMTFIRFAASVGEWLPRALLDRDSLSMLVRGNVGSPDAMRAALGRPPRAPETFIEPSHARAVANAARLAWLLPILRVAVALVWIVTGVISLGVYPLADSYALLARVGLTGTPAAFALYGAAVLDLALGLGALLARRRVWIWRTQMLVMIAYTIIITIFLPEFWRHPYGPVLKNLPMLAAIAMLHEFDAASAEPR